MPLFFLLAAAAAAQPVRAPAPAPAAVTVPPQPALTEQIRARDAAFFALFFTGPCDAARFRTFITDDIEFYHDKASFNVQKAEDPAAPQTAGRDPRGPGPRNHFPTAYQMR